MAVTAADFRVRLKTEHLGQTCLNIWHYSLVSGTGNAAGLRFAFNASIVPRLRSIATDKVAFQELEVKSLVDPLDFDLFALTGTGSQSGSTLGSHDAWSFRYTTNRTDAKDGGKRFVGVGESYLQDGEPIAAMSALLIQAEADLEGPISGVTGQYRPRVLGSRTGVLGQFMNTVSDVSFIGQYTQNTRKKYTRGIF